MEIFIGGIDDELITFFSVAVPELELNMEEFCDNTEFYFWVTSIFTDYEKDNYFYFYCFLINCLATYATFYFFYLSSGFKLTEEAAIDVICTFLGFEADVEVSVY